jgi:hypothetical protein
MTGHLFLAGATTGIENRIILDDPATAEPEERRQLEGSGVPKPIAAAISVTLASLTRSNS